MNFPRLALIPSLFLFVLIFGACRDSEVNGLLKGMSNAGKGFEIKWIVPTYS